MEANLDRRSPTMKAQAWCEKENGFKAFDKQGQCVNCGSQIIEYVLTAWQFGQEINQEARR